MNVLLIGSGGREHALAWKLAQSPKLGKLFATPGNPGVAEHARIVDIDPADHRATVDFCLKNSVELVVIGPEAPLVDGLADNLRTMGFGVFGPNTARPMVRRLSPRPSTRGASGPMTTSSIEFLRQKSITAR